MFDLLERRSLLTTQNWISTAGANWTTSANWSSGPIQTGDTLVFGSLATQTTTNNNEAEGNYNIQLSSTGYTLGGTRVDLAGASAISAVNAAGSGSNLVNLPLSVTSNATFAVSNANTSLVLGGAITSGSATTVTETGRGVLVLNSSSTSTTFAGGLDVQGSAQIDGTLTPGTVTLDGGSLYGIGSIGDLNATLLGGSLTAGDIVGGSVPGTLTANSVTLNNAVTFDVTANGPSSGQYGQLSTSGVVNLSDATLNFTLNYAPANTDTFVIVESTTSSAVAGRFEQSGVEIPQGGTYVTTNGTKLIVNYAGGTAGNEVILSVAGTPVANPDTYSTPTTTTLLVPSPGVLTNDTDPSGLTLHPIIATQPKYGTLTLNDDGSFSYIPSPALQSAVTVPIDDTFQYYVTDGVSQSADTTVTIYLNPVNQPPVASPDSYTAVENTQLSVASPGVLSSAYSPENATLTASLQANASHGSVVLNADGSFTYTPNTNYTGTDTFTYLATDSNGLASSVETVTLNVGAKDVASTVVNSTFTVAENGSVFVANPGVLANAVNPSGNTLSAILLTSPIHGALTLQSDGSFTYTPTANYSGSDSFTYDATDGTLPSTNTATVTLTVVAVPIAPTAGDVSYSVSENHTLTLATPGILLNAQNPSGDALTVTAINGPLDAASFTLNNDGSFTYTPAANFSGTDTFSYYLTSGGLFSNSATVTINVLPVPIAPVANPDAYSTNENSTLSVGSPGVLANDVVYNGGTLSAVLTSGASHGDVTLSSDGSFVYTPASNFSGTDTFSYEASSGALVSVSPAVVTVTVNPVPIAPTAANDSFIVTENQTLTVAAPGILLNAQNPSGGALTVTVRTGPLHASVFSVGNNGSLLYTPDANFTGTDSFSYYLTSDGLTSNVATVTFDVAAVAIAPVANPDFYGTNENTALSVAAPGVLANDVAYNGTTLSAILVNGPSHGTVSLLANGSFLYVPSANYYGTDTFSYNASDGTQISALPAIVTVTVTQTFSPPVASDSTYTVQGYSQLTVPAPGVLATATDPQSLPLSAQLVTSTLDGFLSLAANGGFVYTPNAGYSGIDSFTFRATDGTYTSNLATVTINVLPVVPTSVVIDPSTITNVSNASAITRDKTPAFTGTTGPGLLVELYFKPANTNDPPTLIAATYADANGKYSVASAPLGDGVYSFSVQAVRPNGLGTGMVSAGNVQIVTQPVVVTNVFMVPRTGQIMITYSGGGDALNLATLVNPANYSFSKRNSANPRSYEITSVTLVPPANPGGPVTVALTSSAGGRIKMGHYLFAILSGGIQDLAGNLLDGAYSGSYPSGDSVPGSQFSGMFINHGQPNVPLYTTHFIPILTKHAAVKVADAAIHRGPLARIAESRNRRHAR